MKRVLSAKGVLFGFSSRGKKKLRLCPKLVSDDIVIVILLFLLSSFERICM
jgi:hypothetical protein